MTYLLLWLEQSQRVLYSMNVFNISVGKYGDNVETGCGDLSDTPKVTDDRENIIFRYGLKTLTYDF